jgi:NTP pyrophosphatase (non-canonical NTP hydrolase)
MNLNNYYDFTNTVWKEPVEPGAELAILGMGLMGESGEVGEMIKKSYHYGRKIDADRLEKELGDVIFYWVRLCRYFGFDPDGVINRNIDKLMERQDKGTIWGEGSDR